MKDYSQRLPRDRDGGFMTNSLPPFPSNAVNLRENGATSSVWTLNPNTTNVQVVATSFPVGIKWAGNQQVSVFGSVGGMSYDAIVPANSQLLFAVPRSVMGITSIAGMNVQEGLYSGLATRSLGIGSVLLTEY